jgi:DNA-binding response OmpR family regulator
MLLLIIDDDVDSAELLGPFLEQSGHQVVKAYTGEEGLKAASEKKPDAAFVDIMLPDRSGIDVLKTMKKTDSEMPVIMITGFKDVENVVNAFRAGSLDCLLKPFNHEYLKNDILPKIPIRKR